MARPKFKAHSVNEFSAYFIDCGETVRIWRDGWFSDQFEVVDREKFEQIKNTCSVLNIPLIDKTDEA